MFFWSSPNTEPKTQARARTLASVGYNGTMASRRSALASQNEISGNDPLRELFEACRNGDLVRVKKLVTPQNVNARDTAGRKSSPLHFAAGEQASRQVFGPARPWSFRTFTQVIFVLAPYSSDRGYRHGRAMIWQGMGLCRVVCVCAVRGEWEWSCAVSYFPI